MFAYMYPNFAYNFLDFLFSRAPKELAPFDFVWP